MVMIDEFAIGSDQAIAADLNMAADIEFTPFAHEYPVAKNNAWSGLPVSIVFKENVIL